MYGLEGFSEHEIIELILFYSIPRCNTNEIAHALLARFGSINEVLHADEKQLCTVAGISDKTALYLKIWAAVFGICQAQQAKHNAAFASIHDAIGYVLPYYEGKTAETPAVLLLDEKRRPIRLAFLERGAFTACSVGTAQIAKMIFDCGASAFVLFHNHPNGVPSPSEEDLLVTRQLRSVFLQLGHPMLEHIIVCNDGYYEIMAHHMSSIKPEFK